jgi:hypothetical protein
MRFGNSTNKKDCYLALMYISTAGGQEIRLPGRSVWQKPASVIRLQTLNGPPIRRSRGFRNHLVIQVSIYLHVSSRPVLPAVLPLTLSFTLSPAIG